MICIFCAAQTRVSNSRPQKKLCRTWRRRSCIACGAVFTTLEVVDYETSWTVTAADGNIQPFLRDKLYISIVQSLGHRTDATSAATALTATIMVKLQKHAYNGSIQRSVLISEAKQVLRRFDAASAVHYAAYHHI